MLEISNSTIVLNGERLQFSNNIYEAAEYDDKLVIVFDTDKTEDEEYFDNVFCYTKEKQLLWRVKPAPAWMAGTARSRHVGVSIINHECYVTDFCGRQFLLDMQNGKPVSMQNVK